MCVSVSVAYNLVTNHDMWVGGRAPGRIASVECARARARVFVCVRVCSYVFVCACVCCREELGGECVDAETTPWPAGRPAGRPVSGHVAARASPRRRLPVSFRRCVGLYCGLVC